MLRMHDLQMLIFKCSLFLTVYVKHFSEQPKQIGVEQTEEYLAKETVAIYEALRTL